MLPIGTKVYYTGDIANHDGHFTVAAHRNGTSYDLQEVGGDRLFKGVFHIAEQYNGTCSDRFVTATARAAHRDASIKEMKRAAERRGYLAKMEAANARQAAAERCE